MSDSELVAVCPSCGTDIPRSAFGGHERGLALYKCPKCGFLLPVEELHGPDAGDKSLPPARSVSVRWLSGEPTVREVGALRQLFPQFADRPIGELLSNLSRPELLIGEYADWEAQDLTARAAAVGLQLTIR